MGKRRSEEKPAEIVREYGPYPDAPHIGGVTFDGRLVWFAGDGKLQALRLNGVGPLADVTSVTRGPLPFEQHGAEAVIRLQVDDVDYLVVRRQP